MINKKIFLSVVIPAYNEEENFKKGVLKNIDPFLKRQNLQYEIIIVNDGSTDKTSKLIEDLIKNKTNWGLINLQHQGKAATIIAGFKKSKGDLILFTDFDQATPISEVNKLMAKVNKNHDLAIGSREIKGSKRQKEPFYRHLMGKCFNLIVQSLIVKGIYDTQCGFKLFTKKAIKKIIPSLVVYKNKKVSDAYTGALDVEILFLAKKFKLKIAEVPVVWTHIKTTRVNPIKDSLRMFFDVVNVRIADLFGKYNE